MKPFEQLSKRGMATYVARYQRKSLREFIEWLAPVFDRYLETGLIRK